MKKKSNYYYYVLKNAPRILTQVDRDIHSPTYGSCDRNHWHYKIRDFTSAILQQTGLTLAILYNTEFDGNIYYKNVLMKDWAEATVKYWTKVQLRDGSFNEYYPNEHGFPPTAFSLYGVCEVYKRLELKNEYYLKKFIKTAKYLINHIEEKAFNQEIASITALYSLYSIIKEAWLLDGIELKLNRVLMLQSNEGWFPEYGGADLGYLSVSLDMLSEYYYMTNDQRVVEPINRMISFIKYFVHPDASTGGEYGSRNTTYFLPNGLEVAIQIGNREAVAIKNLLFSNSEKYNYFLDSTDDRYLTHYLLHSFLRSIEKENKSSSSLEPSLLPFQTISQKFFEESGLISYCCENFFAIVSLKKGGVIKIFNKDNEQIFVDCGHRVSYEKGTIAATNWLDDSYSYDFRNNVAEINGYMNKVTLKVSTTIMHVGLRALAFIFGNKIVNMLKSMLIFVDKHNDIEFKRKIIFDFDQICIDDEFYSNSVFILERASNMSLRHVASGKFFEDSDLLCKKASFDETKKIKIRSIFSIATRSLSTNLTYGEEIKNDINIR